MIRESPVAFYERQLERQRAKARRTLLVLFVLLVIFGVAAVLAFSGCSSAPRPEDQAALVSLATTIDAARDRVLTQAEVDEAHAQLVELGASLADIQRARVAAEVWDVARPIVTAGVSLLVSWMTGGGA